MVQPSHSDREMHDLMARDEPEYWFHDCDGDAVLDADFFVTEDADG